MCTLLWQPVNATDVMSAAAEPCRAIVAHHHDCAARRLGTDVMLYPSGRLRHALHVKQVLAYPCAQPPALPTLHCSRGVGHNNKNDNR